jgi:urease accessory protein
VTNLLRLLQLADSALPVGGLAHSFGLETMIEEGDLAVSELFGFLKDLLSEGLLLDAVFCHRAHLRAQQAEAIDDLNVRLSALKLARESREASLALGRRFSALVAALDPFILICSENTHFVLAFGYAGGALGLGAEETVAAFLQQSVTSMISVCQRLLRLGQLEAAQINWDLKPYMAETALKSALLAIHDARSFAHLPELESMRHPMLPTRLFVS